MCTINLFLLAANSCIINSSAEHPMHCKLPFMETQGRAQALDNSNDPSILQPLHSLSSDIIFVTTGYDQVIKFWDPLSGICTRTITYPESHINCMALSNDKQHLLVGSNPNARIYDIQADAKTPMLVYQGHSGNVTAVGMHRDFRWLFTASEDRTIRIWDVRCAKAQREYQNSSSINDACLHPNQGEIYTVDQRGSLKIWDLVNDTCMQELIPEENTPAQSVSISSDGCYAAIANYSGNCYLWRIIENVDVADLKPAAFTKAHNEYITRLLFSPDSQKLATASKDGTVKIWAVAEQMELLQQLQGHTRWVWDVAFSADSAYLVSASSDHSARLWDVESGELVRSYIGHEKALTALALNDYVESSLSV